MKNHARRSLATTAGSVIAILALTAVNTLASPFNIRFHGSGSTALDSTYGAVAEQPGHWNAISSKGPTQLLDLNGDVTSAAVSVNSTNTYVHWLGQDGNNPDNALRRSSFYVIGTEWQVSMTGLIDGTYDVYVYAPDHPDIYTGNYTINGVAMPAMTGMYGSWVEGVSWDMLSGVTISGGTLDLQCTNRGPSYAAGLSGIQIVIPEPTSAVLLALTAVGALGIHRIRRMRKACSA